MHVTYHSEINRIGNKADRQKERLLFLFTLFAYPALTEKCFRKIDELKSFRSEKIAANCVYTNNVY